MRITVFLDDHGLDQWMFRLIRKLAGLPGTEIEVRPFGHTSCKGVANAGLIFRLHVWLDRFLFGRAFGPYNIHDLGELPGVKVWSEPVSINPDEPEASADLIINLSSCSQVGVPPVFGIWQCLTAGNAGLRSGLLPAVYQALNRSLPVMDLELECLSAEGRDILFVSHVPVEMSSLLMNVNYIGGVFNQMIIRQIRSILTKGKNEDPHNGSASVQEAAHFQAILPGNFAAAFNLVTLFSKYAWKRLRSTDKWKWHLIHWRDSGTKPFPGQSFRELYPPPDRFWADPFVLQEKDRIWIFIEEVEFRKNRGIIRLLELNNTGSLVSTKAILERPYHLSYPFVFRHHEMLYMIPETCSNRTIELYSSVRPEGPWTHVMNLMEDVLAKDTTLFYHNEKWWMFTSMKDPEGESDFEELYLFHSDSFLTTGWTAHPKNPVSSDIRTSRPAGNLYTSGTSIYRPSQDCAQRYGRALNINRVIEMDENEYREEKISTLEAHWKSGLKGVHTFNFDGDFCILDAYKY